jgi:phospholipid/cholesterol/gamma-HCH transport system permease protein
LSFKESGKILVTTIESLGAHTLESIEGFGHYIVFLGHTLQRTFVPPLSFGLLVRQVEFVGSKSTTIILLAGIMVGGIFGFQLGEIFRIFGAESMMGAAAAYTLSREMAPVVGGMLVAGRAGSAMAAEIAIMRVNEQIDAMRVMSVNPLAYLVAPRVVATVLVMPLLTSLFTISGVITSFFVGIGFYDIDVGLFLQKLTAVVKPNDVFQGLQKSVVFGLILSSVGCYQGFYARGGAKGVGKATTQSVVISFVLILVSDFFITYLQYKWGR